MLLWLKMGAGPKLEAPAPLAQAAAPTKLAAASIDEAPPEPSPASPALPSPSAAKEASAAAPAPTSAAGATLEIATSPALLVAVDGQAAGRAPVTAPVAAGRHRLTLSEPSLGVQLVRTVEAKPGANRLSFSVGKGAVTVEAPDGCAVRIDGRVVGTTPLGGPVSVFEGSHRIQVKLGAAIWQQAFRLQDGEQMRFDVEAEARESP